MKLAEIIAKRLRRMTLHGGELQGVSAPVIAAVADLTLLELDEILGPEMAWNPCGDYELCESCELVMKEADARHDAEGVPLCVGCARDILRDAQAEG